MKYTSKSLEETKDTARILLDTIAEPDSASAQGFGETRKQATVVALQGDLGAGKTTFTQAVGEILGIKENMASPTFVIEKIYAISWEGFKNLIHIDAYRIEKEEELLHLGWEKIVAEPENLIFIEWPENVKGLIPEDARKVLLKFVDESTREIII